jgi:hypothetical protein
MPVSMSVGKHVARARLVFVSVRVRIAASARNSPAAIIRKRARKPRSSRLMGKSNFTLKTQCEVTNINLDNSGKHAKSVTYVDAQGYEYEQPVELIVLGSYNLHTFICC